MKKKPVTTPLGKIEILKFGWPIIRFHDYYNTPCFLAPSSLVHPRDDEERLMNPGTSAVYLGVDRPDDNEPEMQLTRKQVAALVYVLQKWLRTGKMG